MNIGIAKAIANNVKIGDVIHSAMVRDKWDSGKHINSYSVVLRELAEFGVLKKLKMNGRNMEYRVIDDIGIAIKSEEERRKKIVRSGGFATPFSDAFPSYLVRKFNELISGARL